MLLLKSFTSDDRSIVPRLRSNKGFLPQKSRGTFTFIAHQGFPHQILAYMLDSLVRVSRRVNENHFVRISKTHLVDTPNSTHPSKTAQLCCPQTKLRRQGSREPNGPLVARRFHPQSNDGSTNRVYNRRWSCPRKPYLPR
jgi:hypothetical protein